MLTSNESRSTIVGALVICMGFTAWNEAVARPTGFVKATIPLNAPPVGLAFDGSGVLFALEGASFGSNEATLRTIFTDGTFGDSFPVRSTIDEGDNDNFFVGSMTYDSAGERLLISDNTADGRLYSVDSAGNQLTIASGIAGIAGVAVRGTGEIFVSTSPFGSEGEVLLVHPATNSTTPVLGGLGFGAGLAFDLNDDLIVQDADSATFLGRLQRLPIANGTSGLEFGSPELLLSGMQSSAGVVVDSEGDVFTTGSGGIFRVAGSPLAELQFDENGNAFQFATAIAFDPGSLPFEGFRGSDGGRMAYMADFGFASQDMFITLLTPARAGDYNSDGDVDAEDYALWGQTYGSADDPSADGDLDGIVSASDYVIWRKFAPEVFSTFAPTITLGVPEPTTDSIVLVLFAAATTMFRRRRALV
jgi:hypothetical protein